MTGFYMVGTLALIRLISLHLLLTICESHIVEKRHFFLHIKALCQTTSERLL